MINESICELFEAISNSSYYKDYLAIGNVLKDNDDVNDLVCEIKKLQQESVNLEYKGDSLYKEIDKIIDEKVKILNDMPVYREYLRRMNEFNDILSQSSYNIEKYINEKI